MSESKQGPSFDDTLLWFVEKNKLEPGDITLLTHDGLMPPSPPMMGELPPEQLEAIDRRVQVHRDRAKMAIDLLAIRATERQAKAQQHHATAVATLTIVLIYLSLLQSSRFCGNSSRAPLER